MGNFLRLSAGILKSFAESGAPTIYDRTLTVVSGSPGSYQIVGPISSSTAITLPDSQTYDSTELELWVNNFRLDHNVGDFNYVGGSAPRTQISMNFNILVGDTIRFRIDRGP